MTISPLPRRDAVIDLLAAQKRALHINEIASRLGVEEPGYVGLQRMLDNLAFDGSITPLAGQRFKLGRDQSPPGAGPGGDYEGTLSVHPRGFGFVSAADHAEDVFVPPEALMGALHGDTVRVQVVTRSRRGVEGRIVRVVKRRNTRVAGVIRGTGKSLWIEPDDSRVRGPIVLTSGGVPRGKEGEAAVCAITRFPESPDENPEGILLAVLGVPGEPNVEVAKVLLRAGIEEAHPPDAVTEAEAYGTEVSAEALVGREDLTGIPLPTIDPEDARDHDDAVWVVRNEDGSYRAWIAIADVSHYVRPETALDISALARANSIYFPDRAIPMLPRALSSNLCSLLPGVIRLCLAVLVDLDATGEVRSFRVVEGYMRSAAKLTYPGVARALGFSSEPPRSEEAEAMREDLRVAWDLAKILRGRRMRRGALDFDLPEAKVLLDPETGAPIGVERRTRDPGISKAYQLIEELMLLANEVTARYLVERGAPAIFRNHGSPDTEKLARFVTLCGELGVPFEIEDAADPKSLSAFLKKISGHPQKEVLHMLLLRAMKQANYDTNNIGHFGLASSAYLHFTSPIRRYPDLVVHRAIRRLVRGEPVDKSEAAIERLRAAATTASERERASMEVEREVVDLYRALLMRSHIGDTFEGKVTAIVGTGLFVALDEPFVDVLVRMESLGPDTYEVDDENLRVVGARSGHRIGLGDRMLVQIEDVAVLRRTVYGRRVVGPNEVSTDRKSRKKKEAPVERSRTRKTLASRTTSGRPTKGRAAPPGRKRR
jgi:ribonuclease R